MQLTHLVADYRQLSAADASLVRKVRAKLTLTTEADRPREASVPIQGSKATVRCSLRKPSRSTTPAGEEDSWGAC